MLKSDSKAKTMLKSDSKAKTWIEHLFPAFANDRKIGWKEEAAVVGLLLGGDAAAILNKKRNGCTMGKKERIDTISSILKATTSFRRSPRLFRDQFQLVAFIISRPDVV